MRIVRLVAAVSLCAMLAAALSPVLAGVPISVDSGPQKHTFRFDARTLKARPKSVVLAGSFNHFSRTDAPMIDDGKGVYSIEIELPPGVHHYKYLVNGEEWFADPLADKSLEAMDDHNNSGVLIGLDPRKLPSPKPNAIEPHGISHDPTSEGEVNVASGELLRLRLRAQAGDIENVSVLFQGDDQKWHRRPLASVGAELGLETFAGSVNPSGDSVQYLFELRDGSTSNFLAGGMVCETLEEAQAIAYRAAMTPRFETPAWTHHAIWYQIFPERFRNAEKSNDPSNTQRWQSRWYATLPGEEAGDAQFKRNLFRRRYGGDLQGIREKLPYLKSLGVNAIYLNPIFAADSLHKYDTRDYRHVDDVFGVKDSALELTGETDDPATWKWSQSDRVFLDFVEEAHRHGFKVVIDGVFNHMGKSNALFQDVLQKGKSSRYADWFEIVEWDNGKVAKYKSWNGFNGDMPLIRKDPVLGLAPGPREYLLAVTRRWLSPDGDVNRGVDGFRLDAADRVPHPFWVEFRNVVKSTKPDAYITGEIWGWSQAWLKGDQFDAVMNYRFSTACDDFFVHDPDATPPRKLAHDLARIYYTYPLQVVLAQQNLLDSHDTDRFVSRFLNPNRTSDAAKKLPYDISKPSPEQFARARQAIALQMTFPGAPMIYYGDEAGMWSDSDPHDRMPMWWDDLAPFDEPEYAFNRTQFAFYQRTIAARRQFAELRDGDFAVVLADDEKGVIAFARSKRDRTAYVVFNRSAKPQDIELALEKKGNWTNWLDPAQADVVQREGERPVLRSKSSIQSSATLHLSLPAYGTAILAENEEGK
jgi:glycosidase